LIEPTKIETNIEIKPNDKITQLKNDLLNKEVGKVLPETNLTKQNSSKVKFQPSFYDDDKDNHNLNIDEDYWEIISSKSITEEKVEVVNMNKDFNIMLDYFH